MIKEKKTHCNPILAPVQHAILLSVNREYLVGVSLLGSRCWGPVVVVACNSKSKVPILPMYIRVRTGMDGEGEVLVLQKGFFSGSV